MTAFDSLVLTVALNATWQVAAVAGLALCCQPWLRSLSGRVQHVFWALMLAASGLLVALTIWNTAGAAPGATTGRRAAYEVSSQVGAVWLALYGALVLFRLAVFLRAWRRTVSLRRSAVGSAPRALQRIAERCARLLDARSVPVLVSSEVTTPVTLGTWRPVIILPLALDSRQPAALLVAAIGHELAHVRRRDFLWNFLTELAWIPISFHPAASLLRRRLRATRELACDELVSTRLQPAATYARSLVSLAGVAADLRTPALSLGAFDGDGLEHRVRRLLEWGPAPPRHALAGPVLVMSAAIGLAAAVPVIDVIRCPPPPLQGQVIEDCKSAAPQARAAPPRLPGRASS